MSGNQTSRLCARLGRSIPDVAVDCEPAPGAHLVTQRSGYEHHGIYVGNGRVVHYAGFAGSLHRGPIEETTLERFAAGREICIRVHAMAMFTGLSAAQQQLRAPVRVGPFRREPQFASGGLSFSPRSRLPRGNSNAQRLDQREGS
jgi:hypothetical protein